MRDRPRTLLARTVAVAALLALVSLVQAQTTLDLAAYGFRVQVPDGWTIQEDADGDEVLLFVSLPDGEGALILGSGPLYGAERTAYETQGLAGLLDASYSLVQHLPGVQRGEPIHVSLAGVPSMAFDFRGTELAGRFVYLVSDGRAIIVGTIADAAGAASADAAFELALETFAVVGAERGADDGPERDAFVGTFGGDGLVLELERADGAYVGRLTFQGQTFPVTAWPSATGAVAGQFTSESSAFDFDLVRDGATLVLTSGGSRYTLR